MTRPEPDRVFDPATGETSREPSRRDPALCGICRRPLAVPGVRLSDDCGGDCWGCIGWFEADLGDPESSAEVAAEIRAGLRLPDGCPADRAPRR